MLAHGRYPENIVIGFHGKEVYVAVLCRINKIEKFSSQATPSSHFRGCCHQKGQCSYL
jgi:hypothetical protein